MRMAVSSVLYILGVVLMLAADAQKYFTLKYLNFYKDPKAPKKPFLIDSGFFKYTRNPNYLGEMMLYFGFFNITGHWIAYSVCLVVWCGVFTVRMAAKDASLRQKPGWEEYKQQSWLVLPKLFGSAVLSVVVYAGMAFVAFKVYNEMPQELAAPVRPKL